MSDEKQLEKMIPRMYRWKLENIGLFFFIKAKLQDFPTMTIQQAIAKFRKMTGITYDEWDDESMRAVYGRLQKEFYEDAKKNCRSTKPKGSTAE